MTKCCQQKPEVKHLVIGLLTFPANAFQTRKERMSRILGSRPESSLLKRHTFSIKQRRLDLENRHRDTCISFLRHG